MALDSSVGGGFVTKEGTLIKLGYESCKWQERKFSLKRDVLLYYPMMPINPHKIILQGAWIDKVGEDEPIDLIATERQNPLDGTPIGKKHVLKLQALFEYDGYQQRTFYLVAPNETVCDEWYKALAHNISLLPKYQPPHLIGTMSEIQQMETIKNFSLAPFSGCFVVIEAEEDRLRPLRDVIVGYNGERVKNRSKKQEALEFSSAVIESFAIKGECVLTVLDTWYAVERQLVVKMRNTKLMEDTPESDWGYTPADTKLVIIEQLTNMKLRYLKASDILENITVTPYILTPEGPIKCSEQAPVFKVAPGGQELEYMVQTIKPKGGPQYFHDSVEAGWHPLYNYNGKPGLIIRWASIPNVNGTRNGLAGRFPLPYRRNGQLVVE